jgi:YidC/Oxa1 family membrane protein insertase
MADPDKPQTSSKKTTSEMPMERRMLLALGLVGVVLFLSQYLYSPSAPQNTGAVQTKQAEPKKAAEPPKPAPEAAPPQPDAAPVSASEEQTFTIENDVYKVVFSNRGAVVRSWELKHYKDSTGKPLDLVNTLAAAKTGYPLSLVFENQKPSVDPNQALFASSVTDDGLGIEFDYSNGRTSIRKSLRFGKHSYLVDTSSEVRENGAGIPHMLALRGGFGDRAAYSASAMMKTVYFDTAENKLVQHEAKAAADGPVTVSGAYSFAGIEDAYFAAVFLPQQGQSVKIQTLADHVPLQQNASEEAVAGAAVGGDARNHFSLFVGPKDLDLLRQVNPKLERMVDFGWFSFLARPLFMALNWVNDHWTHNYGWAILLVTIIINMALLPLKITGMKGMKRMAALQPEIQAINKKYEGVSIRDPRKAKQNEEVMALYKRHGVNPLGAGCMPLLLQIPFFFAFYKVLSVAIELRGANWLWINDLANFDPLYLLPIIMVITQFVLQKMTPQTTADPAQQRMMMLMPLVFGFIFFKSPAGLVLYWLTGNIVSIGQQWFINRITPAPAVAVVNAKPQPAKRNVKK